MAKKIFVAYDGSQLADKALDIAAEIVRPNDDMHLDIVHIVPIPLLTDAQAATYQEITDMMLDDGKEVLARAYDRVEDIQGKVSTLLLTGVTPSTEIIKMVEEGDYFLVVLGNRGLSGLKEYMGSVSYKVLHSIDVPVLVAK